MYFVCKVRFCNTQVLTAASSTCSGFIKYFGSDREIHSEVMLLLYFNEVFAVETVVAHMATIVHATTVGLIPSQRNEILEIFISSLW